MLSLRTRIFIVTSLVVLFILGVSLILFISSKKKMAQPEGAASNANGPVVDQTNFDSATIVPSPEAPVTAGLKVKPPTTEEAVKNAAKQTAKIFVERYGSYSTDNNYQNIREVESLVTEALWTKISGKLNSPIPTGAFNGLTTLILSGEFNSWDGQSAELTLKTRRQENRAGVLSSAYQDIAVSLVRQGDNWYVNSFQWK